MRQTIQTMSFILLTGAMLAGCDYKFQSRPPSAVAASENTEKGSGEGLLNNWRGVTDNTDAVAIGAQAVKKRDETMDKLEEVRKQHRLLLDKDKISQEDISKLEAKLAGTEKELTEANEMLMEMQVELAKWKKDVLSFREEMRDSQKVLIEGVTRLHVLISGGVAMDPPKAKPAAPIATNIEEENGDNLR